MNKAPMEIKLFYDNSDKWDTGWVVSECGDEKYHHDDKYRALEAEVDQLKKLHLASTEGFSKVMKNQLALEAEVERLRKTLSSIRKQCSSYAWRSDMPHSLGITSIMKQVDEALEQK